MFNLPQQLVIYSVPWTSITVWFGSAWQTTTDSQKITLKPEQTHLQSQKSDLRTHHTLSTTCSHFFPLVGATEPWTPTNLHTLPLKRRGFFYFIYSFKCFVFNMYISTCTITVNKSWTCAALEVRGHKTLQWPQRGRGQVYDWHQLILTPLPLLQVHSVLHLWSFLKHVTEHGSGNKAASCQQLSIGSDPLWTRWTTLCFKHTSKQPVCKILQFISVWSKLFFRLLI